MQCFKKGQVIKMDVAERSHVTTPYYVEIIYFDEKASKEGDLIMITSIPGQHECKMILGNNWDYHQKRMTIIGDKSKYGFLLYNQIFR